MSMIAERTTKVNPARQEIGTRGIYLLTVRVPDDSPGRIPFLAADDRQAIGQAMFWWGRQSEDDRRTMTVEVAPLQLGRLADGGAATGPALWTYRGVETEGGVL